MIDHKTHCLDRIDLNECLGHVAIGFSGLSAGYGAEPVLRDLTGSIRPGRLVTLIGPNGSGKSTFLRACVGLLPYKGSLTIDGLEVAWCTPTRIFAQLVGLVPQQARMTVPFTVYEAMALGRLPYQGLIARRSEEDEERVVRIAELMELEPLLFRKVTSLSGGEAQRTVLATVLVQDPPVLLLDEPTSALDPYRTVQVFSLLKRLAAEGRTVVAAVHDVNLALAFADAFLAMKDGAIIADAPIAELDGDVLRRLYDTPFEAYRSSEGKITWHALAK